MTPLQLAIDSDPQYLSIVKYLRSKGASFIDAIHLYHNNLRWAARLPWYYDAVSAADAALAKRSLTPQDLTETKHLLRTKLPLVLTLRILDIAEYHGCVNITHHGLCWPEEGSVHIPKIPSHGQMELCRAVFSAKPGHKVWQDIQLATEVHRQDQISYHPELSYSFCVKPKNHYYKNHWDDPDLVGVDVWVRTKSTQKSKWGVLIL